MAAAKKKTTAKNNTKKSTGLSPRSEVTLLITFAVCILLFISNFGVGGFVGNKVSSFFFGIFGLTAYLFPVLFMIGMAFFVSNRNNRIALVKLIAAGLFFVFFCLFLELVVGGSEKPNPIQAFSWAAENKSGGGILGGFLDFLLRPAFGTVGAYVIDIVVLIISMVLITERSFLSGLQRGGKKVYEAAKEEGERQKINRKNRQEEERKLRMENKALGVAVDTKLTPPLLEHSDNVSELKPTANEPFQGNEISFGKGAEPFNGNVAGSSVKAVKSSVNATSSRVSELGTSVNSLNPASNSEPEKEVFLEIPPAKPELDPEDLEFQERLSAEISGLMKHVTEVEWKESGLAPEAEFAEQESEPEPVVVEKVHKKPKMSAGKAKAEEIKHEVTELQEEIRAIDRLSSNQYNFPTLSLLQKREHTGGDGKAYMQETAQKLQQTLQTFGVKVAVTDVSMGPSVTRFEIQPEPGIKVSRIVGLSDDIKMHLAATNIRIEAPIPGKAAVGIEVPNKETVMVNFRDMVESKEFRSHPSSICFTAGKDIGGSVIVADIAKMPHLLIAGSTGSGKSVCINTIIMSLLYKANPEDVKLILIDPKVVELSVYNGIPHLFIPVVTDPKKAAGALHWAVAEMTERYQKFAEWQVRDLKGYNRKVSEARRVAEEEEEERRVKQVEDGYAGEAPRETSGNIGESGLWQGAGTGSNASSGTGLWQGAGTGGNAASATETKTESKLDALPKKLPQIVIVVDELADLMMVAPGEVEDAIIRLAQLARAAGIHLIIATQRPSVDVITGLIKANMPSRVAFAVSSGVDSRTILDSTGAEKLLGNGDMLFYPQGYPKPLRVQGPFVSDSEVEAVVDFLKRERTVVYNTEIEEKINTPIADPSTPGGGGGDNERDAYFADAGKFIIDKDKASIGMLQRWFKIGFNRAARIMDQLEEAGVVGAEEGTKPRKILMSGEEFEAYIEDYV
ncbi:hypothetical protein FACS1894111_01990 [Clostridia bacterium]|nr:hypothetical protein FACS1894111_01990 [Clostridia bacterium]